MTAIRATAFAAVLAACIAPTASAQEAIMSAGMTTPASEAWGTFRETMLTLVAHDFSLAEGTAGPTDPTTLGVTCAAGPCVWMASLHLPSGALIFASEVSVCDNDPVNQIAFTILAMPRIPAAPTQILNNPGVGPPITGCTTFSIRTNVPFAVTVRNDVAAYAVRVTTQPGDLHWNQYRLNYKLQVSPAPPTATFNDVPVGHPYRRFVEALYDSGITGGCGSNNYCPDNPISRGEMAVFLATALGLSFSN